MGPAAGDPVPIRTGRRIRRRRGDHPNRQKDTPATRQGHPPMTYEMKDPPGVYVNESPSIVPKLSVRPTAPVPDNGLFQGKARPKVEVN